MGEHGGSALCGSETGQLFDVGLPPIVEDDPRSFVLAATPWLTNGDLIFDCARLGYLKAEWVTLDATYGLGNWWTVWRPDKLFANDLDPDKGEFHHDFRELPWPDGEFDAATLDPPYICVGGRATSAAAEFNGRFGLLTTPGRPESLQDYMNAGLSEVARAVRHRGFILVKCKNYVNSGKLWPGTFRTWQHAESVGLELVDCMEHLSGTGPQSRSTQEHARSNYSTLLVFKKVAR